MQVATQFMHSVLHPVAHPRDMRYKKENVMKYGSQTEDSEGDVMMGTETRDDDDTDDDDNNNEDDDNDVEEGSQPLNLDKVKSSLGRLRRCMAAMPDSGAAPANVSDPETEVRPGVQIEEDPPNAADAFERTGVTHLVHSWHVQGHTKNKASYLELQDF
jgi:hypothetical protein